MGCIVPQTLQRGREAVVGGADPAAVPVADEVPPDQGLQLLNSHVLGVNAVIEQLTLHPGPHALTAGVVMTAATVAIHALADAVLFQRLFCGKVPFQQVIRLSGLPPTLKRLRYYAAQGAVA